MQRKFPSHMIKYYEALGCVADGRVKLRKIEDGIISAHIESSDRSKYYDVSYFQQDNKIMSNDNSSYRKDELGYPSMALLLFLDRLDYQDRFGSILAGISWKKMNTEYNNNRDLTQDMVDTLLHDRGQDIDGLHQYCTELMERVQDMELCLLGVKQKPA